MVEREIDKLHSKVAAIYLVEIRAIFDELNLMRPAEKVPGEQLIYDARTHYGIKHDDKLFDGKLTAQSEILNLLDWDEDDLMNNTVQ